MRFTDLLDALIFWPIVGVVWMLSWIGWLQVGIRVMRLKLTLADLIEWTGTCTIAGLRIAGEKGEVFQAAAHLYLGCLMGVWWTIRDRSASVQVMILCLVEIACFAWNLSHGR